jgi:hypothetical protein
MIVAYFKMLSKYLLIVAYFKMLSKYLLGARKLRLKRNLEKMFSAG